MSRSLPSAKLLAEETSFCFRFLRACHPQDAEARATQAWALSIAAHNGHEITSDDPVVEASAIAARLVRARMQSIVSSGERPIVRLVTRDDVAGHRADATLNFDWRHAFPAGQLPEMSESTRLNTALSRATSHLKDAFGPGHITLDLKAHLHIGVALGHAFRRTTGFTPNMTNNGLDWIAGIDDSDGPGRMLVTREIGSPAVSAASLEISISRDVRTGVANWISIHGRRYRERVALIPPSGVGQTALQRSSTANLWARQAMEEMARLISIPGVSEIDLFLATPIEFAVFLGWWLNASGPINIYHWSGNTGPYQLAWTLPDV